MKGAGLPSVGGVLLLGQTVRATSWGRLPFSCAFPGSVVFRPRLKRMPRQWAGTHRPACSGYRLSRFDPFRSDVPLFLRTIHGKGRDHSLLTHPPHAKTVDRRFSQSLRVVAPATKAASTSLCEFNVKDKTSPHREDGGECRNLAFPRSKRQLVFSIPLTGLPPRSPSRK
jgi:hypothetical protein